jgi:hypothetical protein
MRQRVCTVFMLAMLAGCGDRTPPAAAATPAQRTVAVRAEPPAQAAPAPSPLDILRTKRQERLYYNVLPEAVVTLGQRQDILVAEFDAVMRRSSEPLMRFNLVLVIELRLNGNALNPAERPLALALVERALADPDAWVRTEAAYTLGNLRDAQALPALNRLLDDPAPTVVLHAADAIEQISGNPPAMAPKQAHIYNLAMAAMQNGTIEELANRELIPEETL